MRVVIVGCGRVGSLLASLLSTDGHQVAIIDRDATAFIPSSVTNLEKGDRVLVATLASALSKLDSVPTDHTHATIRTCHDRSD